MSLLHFVMSLLCKRSVVSSGNHGSSFPPFLGLARGQVFITVDEELKSLLGIDSDDYRSICATSRCTELLYCCSALEQGAPRSILSISERSRAPRQWGLINHDFVVVHMIGLDSEGKKHNFSIVAEKGGPDQGGERSGIYIGILGKAEIRDLDLNIFMRWTLFLTPVHLYALIYEIWKDEDPDYHPVSKNCWGFAQAACKTILLFLSTQPDLSSDVKLYFEEQAEAVQSLVITKAALESAGRFMNMWC